MEDLLRITVVQQTIIWEDPGGNIAKLESLINEIHETDIIVLPETFNTGFSMKPLNLFETMDGVTVSWMKSKAKELHAVVTGSLIVKDNGKVYNRCVWATPGGALQWYDKWHLYSMGGEDRHFTAGREKLIAEWKGWRICPLICYDLRFPVWSRNQENYDILMYVANWPSARHHVWKNLLVARAVENQSYCIGVNRTGSDGMGLDYLGDSAMIGPKGYGQFIGPQEKIQAFELSYKELHDFRKKFPVLRDKNSFIFKNN